LCFSAFGLTIVPDDLPLLPLTVVFDLPLFPLPVSTFPDFVSTTSSTSPLCFFALVSTVVDDDTIFLAFGSGNFLVDLECPNTLLLLVSFDLPLFKNLDAFDLDDLALILVGLLVVTAVGGESTVVGDDVCVVGLEVRSGKNTVGGVVLGTGVSSVDVNPNVGDDVSTTTGTDGESVITSFVGSAVSTLVIVGLELGLFVTLLTVGSIDVGDDVVGLSVTGLLLGLRDGSDVVGSFVTGLIEGESVGDELVGDELVDSSVIGLVLGLRVGVLVVGAFDMGDVVDGDEVVAMAVGAFDGDVGQNSCLAGVTSSCLYHRRYDIE